MPAFLRSARFSLLRRTSLRCTVFNVRSAQKKAHFVAPGKCRPRFARVLSSPRLDRSTLFPLRGVEIVGKMRKNRLLSPESSRLFFGTCGVYRYASVPARRLVHFATLARIRTRANPTFFRFLPSPFTFGCNAL